MRERIILAGDIGGTKTALGLFKMTTGHCESVVETTFRSDSYPGLEVMVKEFLGRVGFRIEAACFGVAGPVVGDEASITNLPWRVNRAALGREIGTASVRLMNDLEAIANAVPILEPADLYTLNERQPAAGGAIGVLAPGTGLGEAFLAWDGATYRAYPSEGGHCSFAPGNAMEMDLLVYLLEKFQHVSYERICSGMGLPNLYAFFRERKLMEESPHVVQALAKADDPTPVIVAAALDSDNPCRLCKQTLDTFVSILGAEAGNLALKVLATGGIYLGGGIPPRILPVLRAGAFMESYQHKGRFGAMLGQMPVHVILNPRAALMGAARAGLEGL
ncbi:MAG: glucokinase [Thermodesulfobacteriota bacterium]